MIHRFIPLFAITLAVSMPSAPSLAAPAPEKAAAMVDLLLADELLEAGSSQQPLERADDETFLRRVSLDLIGRLPTPQEITLFSFDSEPDKYTKLVDKLLADKRFGENWAGYWRDVILYRRTEDRSLLTNRALSEYLATELNKNTSWDKIASEFVTAEGDTREDGRTALIFAQGGRPEDTVSEISRIFLGIQVQCAQCHDHPYDQWKREQFHELAAFFPRVAARPDRSKDVRTFVVVSTDSDFRFGRNNPNNRYRGTLEHHMPDLDDPSAKGKQMRPVFFATGQQLPTGVKDADRRGTLAKWITSPDNEWFAKAQVNRIWAELVGEGFYEPVDDMGPDRDCSAPETIDYLAGAFISSGYDVKWLFRTIVATDAYRRQSRPRRGFDDTPFMANAAQRLRGDQLFNVLMSALGVDEGNLTRLSRNGRGRYGRGSPRLVFNFAFGYDPSEPRDEISGSIPQALLLMNSTIINGAISANRSSLKSLLGQIKDDQALVTELYLRCLGRQPTENEIQINMDYVREVGDRSEAFEDLLWTLINSTEFLHRT